MLTTVMTATARSEHRDRLDRVSGGAFAVGASLNA